MPAPQSNLDLLAGGSPESRISKAIDALPAGRSVVVAARTADETARLVARAIQRNRRRVRLIAPSSSLAGALWQARSTDWAEIDVSDRASRLSTVTLPTAIPNAPSVVAVNTISPEDAPGDPIAIGLWARFAHPKLRTGASLSDPRDGLTAEIALAVQPRLILLSAIWRDVPILIATGDQIAAELAGLALRHLLSEATSDPIGPWEHPLVQRATELELGVATPSEIRPGLRWIGLPGDPAEAEIRTFALELFGRIGVVFDG